MQPLASGPKLAAYYERLQSSHDYDLDVQVLTLDEQLVGRAHILDGQVNIVGGQSVRRTASLTLSDPDGALDFSNAAAWSGTSLWANRLVRIRHTVDVPGYGPITATPFVGVPSAMSRRGAEVAVELHDKSALAVRGARPLTLRKGANAVAAVRLALSYCTGEFRFRFPTSKRRLSRAYSVGLTDEASPWAVARTIASRELGWQLIYSCDGYATMRRTPASPVATFAGVTEQASSSIDFSTATNYVLVKGKNSRVAVSRTAPTSHALSASSLKRRGVPRLLPLLVAEPAYTNNAQAAARANSELAKGLGVGDEAGISVIPMFHLDADDLVRAHVNGTTVLLRLSTASIPLGTGGDMSIGQRRWVSKPVVVRR